MSRLVPSILSADFNCLGEQLACLEREGIAEVHFDVMDGQFVPSISFGMPVLHSIRSGTALKFDVHLMIEEPIRYVEEFAKEGADCITVHYEACSDVQKTLAAIHSTGKRAGLAICPETSAEVLTPYLKQAELFLVMSVHPGFGGQKFLPNSPEKIRTVRRMLEERGLSAEIEVDGGIKQTNAKHVLESGADVIVAGSAVFQGGIHENLESFRKQCALLS